MRHYAWRKHRAAKILVLDLVVREETHSSLTSQFCNARHPLALSPFPALVVRYLLRKITLNELRNGVLRATQRRYWAVARLEHDLLGWGNPKEAGIQERCIVGFVIHIVTLNRSGADEKRAILADNALRFFRRISA
jgi:hypothetical protein